MLMPRALYNITLFIILFTIPATLSAGIAAATPSSPARLTTARTHPGAMVSTIGQSQCARPLADRTGNWLCTATPAAQAQAARAVNDELPASGYCKVSGCWYVNSVTDSEYSATGYFGYGNRQLGKVTLFFRVKLTGITSISKPVRFESTIGVRDLVMEGDRLYYDKNWPQGHPVSPSVFAHHNSGNVNGGKLAQWTPNGYKAHPAPVYVGSVWHQWSWHMAGYPGTWYFYATSVLIHRINHGNVYHFGSDKNLGQNPAGGGWNG
jgi:hypothetical protein